MNMNITAIEVTDELRTKAAAMLKLDSRTLIAAAKAEIDTVSDHGALNRGVAEDLFWWFVSALK